MTDQPTGERPDAPDHAPCDTGPFDIIVVGAGIAGLAAARLLTAAGRRVTVLEARPRIGGRLLSLGAGHGALDLGATWFWPGEPRVAALAGELGVATFPQHLGGDALVQGPGGSERIRGNPLDVPSSRFAAGAGSLAAAVAADLPPGCVALDCPVTRIAVGSDRVEAHVRDARVTGSHLVLALPPSLAVASIGFDPALPENLAALAHATPVWMGAMTKIVAHHARPFWREAGLAGAAFSHVGPMREIHDASGPDGEPAALFGFAPPRAQGRAGLGRDAVLAQFRALFGPGTPDPEALHVVDWSTERFTAPARTAADDDYRTYGHPGFAVATLGGRVHFASTETSAEAPGHIEGALAAAERTAQAILRAAA